MALDSFPGTSQMPDWLEQRVRLTPHRLAVLSANNSLSFVDLNLAVIRAQERLSALGVAENSHVAVLLPNTRVYVVVIHALIRLGAVFIPINTRLTPSEIDYRLEASQAAFLIVDGGFTLCRGSDLTSPSNPPNRPNLNVIASELLDLDNPTAARAASSEDSAMSRLDLDSLHSIVFTSGTSGKPKGVMLTYGNHWWNAVGSALNLGLHDNDRWLLCMPIFHVGGLSILFRSVIYGIPAIIHRAFDPAKVSHSIDEDGVTIVSLVPTTLQRLLDHRGSAPFPESLRCVLLGGARPPRSLLEQCVRQSIPVFQTYGLTETASQVATLSAKDAVNAIGSSGKPLFPMELRIDSERNTAEAGQIGEIAVRGPTVTPGYFRDSEATQLAIAEGWLHTGDLGYLSEDGYLFVVDRGDDLIVTGGENVYPAEVENVLLTHPFIREAAVVGIPDPDWGQSIHAAVVLDPGASAAPQDLQNFCRERLASYKIPKHVEFLKALPRNASGKLLRHLLFADTPPPDDPKSRLGL